MHPQVERELRGKQENERGIKEGNGNVIPVGDYVLSKNSVDFVRNSSRLNAASFLLINSNMEYAWY